MVGFAGAFVPAYLTAGVRSLMVKIIVKYRRCVSSWLVVVRFAGAFRAGVLDRKCRAVGWSLIVKFVGAFLVGWSLIVQFAGAFRAGVLDCRRAVVGRVCWCVSCRRT